MSYAMNAMKDKVKKGINLYEAYDIEMEAKNKL